MNDGNASKPQSADRLGPARPRAGQAPVTQPRDIAREALQQSLDRRW